MRRHILIAAVAAVTIQPLTPLPLPSGQTKGNRVAHAGGRIASTGCAADLGTETMAVWNPHSAENRFRGPLNDLRLRTWRMHGRCVPRRECFTNQSPSLARRDPGRWFKTPKFLGK